MIKNKHMLLPYEGKVYSQFGEDGIINFLLERIELKNMCSVEVGWGNGIENNTRYLLENGYKCLAFDMILEQTVQHNNLDLRIHQITIENSLEIIEWNNSPDFFSLDIDSVDWYVLRNLLKNKFNPKIICCEYNAWIGEHNFGVIKTDQSFTRSGVYGASITAFNDLLSEYGYKLFTVNSTGVNAFYYHESVIHSDFSSVPTFSYKDCKARFRKKKYGEINWWDTYSFKFHPSRIDVESFINQNL